MLDGRMRHSDNHGNEGLLTPGSVQWMTAGRGIVHSEMPEQEEGLMRGFQLWVNLPAQRQDDGAALPGIPARRIPATEPAPGVTAQGDRRRGRRRRGPGRGRGHAGRSTWT